MQKILHAKFSVYHQFFMNWMLEKDNADTTLRIGMKAGNRFFLFNDRAESFILTYYVVKEFYFFDKYYDNLHSILKP